MNNITVFGRLTADPSAVNAQSGTICHFNVADNTSRKDASGEYITNFYSCSVFGKNAERALKNLRKGARVVVTGEFILRSYNGRNGEQRLSPDIQVANFAFADSASPKTDEERTRTSSAQSAPSTQTIEEEDMNDEDCPF